jgi:glycosyltransferase involved in cell wall biosynthesis
MRVLVIHNSYRFHGGEDAAVRAETAMLESAGHTVIRYFRSNREVGLVNIAQKAVIATNAIWSLDSYRTTREIVRRERPDVAHCHNLFPLISPSVYSACHDEGIPVVQTLHNFRMLCPGATLFRDGRPREKCLQTRSSLPGVIHGCYRDSHAATAFVAAMSAFHRNISSRKTYVDVYIAVSRFARQKFVQNGLSGCEIEVKYNLTCPNAMPRGGGDFGLYAGRLASEKGISTLLNAWKTAGLRIPLRIAGDGPLRDDLERECARLGLNNVRFDGHLDHNLVIEAMRNSRFVVAPSECYENCPMAIVEAFACGVPVIAARLGAAEEMVEDGRTGWLFEPGNAKQLAETLKLACANPAETESMGGNARAEFLVKYGPARNLPALERIYKRAIELRNLASLN